MFHEFPRVSSMTYSSYQERMKHCSLIASSCGLVLISFINFWSQRDFRVRHSLTLRYCYYSLRSFLCSRFFSFVSFISLLVPVLHFTFHLLFLIVVIIVIIIVVIFLSFIWFRTACTPKNASTCRLSARLRSIRCEK